MSASLYRQPLDLEANRLFAEDFKRLARAGEAMGFPPVPTKAAPKPELSVEALVQANAERRQQVLEIAAPHEGAWPLKRLVEIAAEAGRITVVDMQSNRRCDRIVRARQTYFWLGKRFSTGSLKQIALPAGDKDHTTVLHGIRRVQAVVDALPTEPLDDPRAWAPAILAATWLPSAVRDPRWRKAG